MVFVMRGGCFKMLRVFAIVTISTLTGCAGIWQQGVQKSSSGIISGRQIEIGYFEPNDSGGSYALLRKTGTTWQLAALGADKPQVAPGEELLFLSSRTPETVEITPVFEETGLGGGNTWLTCDPESKSYTACNSALVIKVPLDSKARKLDRDAIALAVRQSGIFERMDKLKSDSALSAQRLKRDSELWARRRSNIKVTVAKVENEPQVLSLVSEDLQRLLVVDAAPLDNESGGAVRLRPQFLPFARSLATGRLTCEARPQQAEYTLEHVDADKIAPLDIVANVYACELVSPRPAQFVATEKGSPVTVSLVSFEPNGSSMVKLSNSSNQFVSISSLSLYYFEKIFTTEEKQELPPHAEGTVTIRSAYPGVAKFSISQPGTLDKESFLFGFAAKYTAGSTEPRTLMKVERLTLNKMLPASR
jgi:hypothetical protein